MTTSPVAPSWPFGRWIRTPKRQPALRTQCAGCAGGGDVNGCPCPGGCGGRGWFDADNPPPKEH